MILNIRVDKQKIQSENKFQAKLLTQTENINEKLRTKEYTQRSHTRREQQTKSQWRRDGGVWTVLVLSS